ncbi:MAG: HTH domain-containing protein [Candidatus Moranbacteria bacterium]|nr:HTH domain-containing protein [Candidatus Moranbacteria bacterium]
MFKDIFLSLTDDKNQSEILDLLAQKRELKASEIAKQINRPRTVIYRDLDKLTQKKLLVKNQSKGKITTYKIIHPEKIVDYYEKKEEELKREKKNYLKNLPDIISAYSLASPRPKIKYFEDREGFKKILWDTLETKNEILTFSDSQVIRKHYALVKINNEYKKERIKRKIKKRIIVPKGAKKYFKKLNEFTKIKALDEDFFAFNSSVQIYDGKVSFQSIEKGKAIGVLIEDKNIFRMMKLLFEVTWGKL